MSVQRSSALVRSLLLGAGLLVGPVLLSGLGARGAAAQDSTDSRWLPWLGCWEAEPATPGSLLCIVPLAGDVGVDMVSIEALREVSRERVRADGTRRESSGLGCSAEESARFSEDVRRIYLEIDRICEGVARERISGMIALLSPTEWIDVRSSRIGESVSTGVSRYRLAPAEVAEAAGFGAVAAERAAAVRTARVAAAAAIGERDVLDASLNADVEVVRAWLAERRQPLRLDGKQLLRLADQGVAPEVIDVVVAVSHPRRFTLGDDAQVELAERPAAAAVETAQRYGLGANRFWDPFWGPGYGYGFYNRYLGGYSWGYDPRYGYGNPGAFRPTVVVVQPRQDEGRVVNGRGYTRAQPGAPSTERSRVPPPNPPPSGSSGAGESGGGGSASGGSSGTSGGTDGSGSSTGRTAMPRPGGE